MDLGSCGLIAHIDKGEDGKDKDAHAGIENGQVCLVVHSSHPRLNMCEAQELRDVIEYAIILPS